MKKFKSVKKAFLFEEVEKQLRASINAGAYGPGEKLPSERELVEQFEVSRATVRDALKGLQSLGLISVKRGINAGAYILEPSSHPIIQGIDMLIQMKKINYAHLIEFIFYIEPIIARNVAIQHIQKDIDALKAMLDQAENTIDASWKKARLINVRFHCELAKMMQNPLMVYLCESITQVYLTMIIEMTHTQLDKNGIIELISEHREILEAIEKKDPEGAFELTKIHLLKASKMHSTIIPTLFDPSVDRRIKQFAKL